MKAVIWTRYGPPEVLQLQDIPKPSPKDNEVLIKVHASTVTAGDCEVRSLKFAPYLSLPMRLYLGVRKPKDNTVLGQELAGEIVAVGKDVTKFKVGDAVFGTTGFHFGGYAEYACLPADSDDGILAIKPENMTFEEAATVPTGGMESLHFLREANLKKDETILINGAGGSIGTYGIQLAKHYGAEVTAVDHTDKLEMMREVGADHVIDYTRETFTKSGKTYDVIFDVIGISSYAGCIRSLNENGRYIMANPHLNKIFRSMWTSRSTSKKVIYTFAGRDLEDMQRLKELVEAGVLRSIIDRRFPLEQTAEAHRYVETGAKKGNVIITVINGDNT